MNFELKKLFEFQDIITDMQKVVVEMMITKKDRKVIDSANARIDKLREIYNSFDSFYYRAHFNDQKILALQAEKIGLAKRISELEETVNKLEKTLAFNEAA